LHVHAADAADDAAAERDDRQPAFLEAQRLGQPVDGERGVPLEPAVAARAQALRRPQQILGAREFGEQPVQLVFGYPLSQRASPRAAPR
jgi:hypothetical protein